MAKFQSRRSVSVKGETYARLKERCAHRGEAISAYVERLIERDVKLNGATVQHGINVEDAIDILRVVGCEDDLIVYAGLDISPADLVSKLINEKAVHRIAARDIVIEYQDVFGMRVRGTLADMTQDRLLERENE